MAINVSNNILTSFTTDILIKVGLPVKNAKLIARNLVEANLRGIDSHGIIR
jgi:LDH2 family malate/lactate/ureidoglycolate dehydrogenase